MKLPFNPRISVFRSVTVLAGLACLSGGCSSISTTFTGTRNAIEIRSVESGAGVRPDMKRMVYQFHDKNSADIILSDFDLADLTEFSNVPTDGQIMHVHFFVRPRPGRTPIAQTACSATVRHIVISRGEIGVYTGAGFMTPKGTPGDSSFGGSIGQAPMRLARATEFFFDPLGPCVASISFSARLDDERTRSLVALVDRLAYVAEAVDSLVIPMPVPQEAAPEPEEGVSEGEG